jgi:hypothetical protein
MGAQGEEKGSRRRIKKTALRGGFFVIPKFIDRNIYVNVWFEKLIFGKENQ